MKAHILALHTTSNPGVGSNVISNHFLKVVILHIKVMVTMQAHILSLHTPDPCFGGQTVIFLKEVMLHIKLKGMEHRAPYEHIICPYSHPQPVGRV